jgi:hypothetical protein
MVQAAGPSRHCPKRRPTRRYGLRSGEDEYGKEETRGRDQELPAMVTQYAGDM